MSGADSTFHLQQYRDQLQQQVDDLRAVITTDPELAPLAQEELHGLESQIAQMDETIRGMKVVAPKSEFTNCIIEFRPGAGGEEAKNWMSELLQMYTRFAVNKNLKMEAVDTDVIKIIGKTAYDTFRFESGVHRVQRVPATENQGRVHTSTATVAVIPEVRETEIQIHEDDLNWQFTRAGGNGGQNVNKVSTAVFLTHIPTGLVVNCRQERSQEQNRVRALMILRAKLWELQEEERLKQVGDARAAIGRASRSEKIRTYNFPQNRLTDHRIPQSWYDLDRRLMGDLDDVIEALRQWEAAGAQIASETENEE